MWANRILLPLASLLALVTLPLVWVSTFVLGLLAQLTFGLILLPLSLVWAVCFLAPLLGTSWLWDRAPILRIPLALLGVPLALLGSVYVALMPSMGELESRKQKLNLCWGWPFSLDIFKFDTGKYLDPERERLILSVINRIDVPSLPLWAKRNKTKEQLEDDLANARAELGKAQADLERLIHSVDPNSDTTPFVPSFGAWWQDINHQHLNLHDALDKYISDHDLAVNDSPDEPEQAMIARVKLDVLESSGITYDGDDASMLERYKMSLRMQTMVGNLRRASNSDHDSTDANPPAA